MGACVALRADDVHGDELRRALAVADDLLGKIDAQVGQRRLKGAGSGVVNGGERRIARLARRKGEDGVGRGGVAIHGDAGIALPVRRAQHLLEKGRVHRSEEHTSELQSLIRISYAVFCLKKKRKTTTTTKDNTTSD